MATVKKTKVLNKELGMLGVYVVALGATLSTGFFLVPGLAAKEAGPAVPLVYLIAAIPLIPAMFSMVELSTAMPRAGGTYYFLDRSMGPLVGTIGGLGTWLVLMLKTAFALIGMGAYLHLLLPDLPVIPVALAFAVLFGVVNIVGAKGAGWFQLVLVAGLLAILIWFMGGVFHIDVSRFGEFFGSGMDSLIGAAGLVYISYIGITKVASVAEEVRQPERDLPWGIFLALITALALYIVGTVVMVGMVPMEELAGSLTPVALAAQHMVGDWGTVLIIVAAILAFSSGANAGILSASRYPLAMGRDHILPERFRKLDKRGNPYVSVVATVALIMLLVLIDPASIAKLASAFQLLLFAIICLAVIVMRESRLDSYDPGFRSPFYPWMQIFGAFAPFVFIAQMGWMPILFTVALLMGGTGWFFHYVRGRVPRAGAIYHIFERLGRRRFEGLDAELRGILKEKGLREQDPFDDVVARALVVDVPGDSEFEAIARRAAGVLAERVPATAEHIMDGFMRGTRVGATPVSHGTALPHLRLAEAEHSEMVLVRAHGDVRIKVMDEFGEEVTPDEPVHAVFFLVSPENDPGRHLRILAQLAGRADDDDFMEQWLSADHDQDLKETLLRDERYLSIALVPGSPAGAWVGQPIHDLSFPQGCLIALIRRGDWTFVPGGSTVLSEGDRMTIIGAADGIKHLRKQYVDASRGDTP